MIFRVKNVSLVVIQFSLGLKINAMLLRLLEWTISPSFKILYQARIVDFLGTLRKLKELAFQHRLFIQTYSDFARDSEQFPDAKLVSSIRVGRFSVLCKVLLSKICDIIFTRLLVPMLIGYCHLL
jgi:hypothetical protein